MPWWGWIAMGALLLGAELAVVDAEFYLVFVGISAATVGALRLLGLTGPWWSDWLIFAALSVVTMVTFRRRIYGRLRGGLPNMQDTIVGQFIVVEQSLSPGDTGRAEFRGTTWTVLNLGHDQIEAGQRCRIERVDGLALHVQRSASTG